MYRIMLKSKIHCATVTDVQLHYQGSITVDAQLLTQADILPYEQVHVLNRENGNRVVTYAIEAESGKRDVILNGPAARCGMPGDRVVILSYKGLANDEKGECRPRVIKLDSTNSVVESEHGT